MNVQIAKAMIIEITKRLRSLNTVSPESKSGHSELQARVAKIGEYQGSKILFGVVEIGRTRHANIPSVVLGPGHGHGQRSERQNNPGNGDGDFLGHDYASFFGAGAMVMVKPQLWQR